MNNIFEGKSLKEKINYLKSILIKKVEAAQDKNEKRKFLYHLIGIDTIMAYLYDINGSIIICKDNINKIKFSGDNPQPERNILTKKYFSLQDNMVEINAICIDTFENKDCIIFNTRTHDEMDKHRLELETDFSKEEIRSLEFELDIIYAKYEEFLKKQIV